MATDGNGHCIFSIQLVHVYKGNLSSVTRYHDISDWMDERPGNNDRQEPLWVNLKVSLSAVTDTLSSEVIWFPHPAHHDKHSSQ